jgi:hypothetical protein
VQDAVQYTLSIAEERTSEDSKPKTVAGRIRGSGGAASTVERGEQRFALFAQTGRLAEGRFVFVVFHRIQYPPPGFIRRHTLFIAVRPLPAAGQFRGDHRRRNFEYPDGRIPQLVTKREAEGVDGRLRCAIDGDKSQGGERQTRRNINDGGGLPAPQMGNAQRAKMYGGQKIDGDFFIRGGDVVRALAEVDCTLDPGVIDQDIEIAELGCDPPHQRPARCGLRDIADADNQSGVAFLCRQKTLPAAAADDDRILPPKQAFGQCQPNSRSAAGYQNRVTVGFHLSPSPGKPFNGLPFSGFAGLAGSGSVYIF